MIEVIVAKFDRSVTLMVLNIIFKILSFQKFKMPASFSLHSVQMWSSQKIRVPSHKPHTTLYFLSIKDILL